MNDWPDHTKGLVLAIVGVLILTPDALLVRLITADQWSLLFWRGFFTFITLTLYLMWKYKCGPTRPFRALNRRGVFIATLFGVNTILFVISIRHTAVANTLVILSITPIFAATLSSFFWREHAPLRTWVTAVVGVACIAAIMGEGLGQATFIGDGAAVGVALLLAVILTMLRHGPNQDPVAIVGLGGLFAAGAVVGVAAPLSLMGMDWVYVAILGGFVVPVSFALTAQAPKYLPAPEVSLIFLLETVLGPLWAWLVIDEVPPELTLLGGGILIGALIVHMLLGLRSKRTSA